MGARCIIVGAGMCGLLAGERLQDAGLLVTVLDKGSGVGGRLATRRIGDAVLDHGAQFFTARERHFQARVARWQAEGIVAPWFVRHTEAVPDEPCFAAPGGMNRLAKHVATNLNVVTGTQVSHIERRGATWRVQTQAGPTYEAEVVLVTAPVPQSLALVEIGDWRVPEPLRARLAALTYDPCLALLLVLDRAPRIPPGGQALPPTEAGPLAWLADNHQKGVSSHAHAVTLLGAPGWSRAAFDQPDKAIAQTLRTAAAPWLGDAGIVASQVKKWRYARVSQASDTPFAVLHDAPLLVMAGDAFGGPRVEAAVLSGWAAADAILRNCL